MYVLLFFFLPVRRCIRGQNGLPRPRPRPVPYPPHLPIAILQPWVWVFVRSLRVCSPISALPPARMNHRRVVVIAQILVVSALPASASSYYPIGPDQMPLPKR